MNDMLNGMDVEARDLITILKTGRDVYFEIKLSDKKKFKNQIDRILRSLKKQHGMVQFFYDYYVFFYGMIISRSSRELEVAFTLYLVASGYIKSIGGEVLGDKLIVIYRSNF